MLPIPMLPKLRAGTKDGAGSQEKGNSLALSDRVMHLTHMYRLFDPQVSSIYKCSSEKANSVALSEKPTPLH
jgi:hypothetical protein